MARARRKAVAETLTPHETIFIDSSSSAYFVVREILKLATPLSVVTNSLPVMSVDGADDLIGIGRTCRKSPAP